MCAVSVDDFHLRTEQDILAEDLQHWPSLDDTSAKRMLRLKPND
jgi:hypothetical protein